MVLREIDNEDTESMNSQMNAFASASLIGSQQQMQANNSQSEAQVHSFKPGSIKSIKLINFMCHETFELSFGSRVNFVIGPNGSGKSALLTALVVALGGRATVTSRAKRADDFVMYGKNQAKIVVVLHNYEKASDKYQGFKPEDYGKFIVVEKTLLKDGAAKLVLKNDKDKKVSERKSELDEMLDHFGILINNPICILNQEVSKTFLHSKKPEDKFDLFMKATNLEQIEQDYDSAQRSHKEWNESNQQKALVFKLLDKEHDSCVEKLNFLLNRGKMIETRERLNEEYLWAVVRDNESLSKELETKVKNIEHTIKSAEDLVEKKLDKIKKSEEEIQGLKAKIESANVLVEETRKKVFDIRVKETDIKTKQVDVRQKAEQSKRKIARLKQDKASLENSIKELKEKFRDQNALDQDNEQRKLRIEELEREKPHLEAKEKSWRSHTNQLSSSMTSLRGELHAANLRASELKNKLYANQATLRRLKSGQSNPLGKFGDQAIRINDEIETAFRQKKFNQRPLGPLGYYIKLKNSDIAKPLECHLGQRNANAYVCDNHADMTVLNSMFKRMQATSTNFRQPTVITRKFGPRHDVTRHKATHDTYRTFLDFVEIENDVVFNVLVDRCSLESVLFIPEYDQAEHLMINPQLVPKRVMCAYTKECSVMHPKTERGCYKSFANNPNQYLLFVENNSSQVAQIEREIDILQADIRDAERICKTTQESFNVQRMEYESNSSEIKKILAEIRQKEEELLKLKTTVTVQPQELSVFEGELDALITSIGKEEVSLSGLEEVLASFDGKLEDVRKEKADSLEKQKIRENERAELEKMVEATKATINDHQSAIRSNKASIQVNMRNKTEESEKLETALRELAASKSHIGSDSVRPRTIQPTANIKKELATLDRQLAADLDEMRDPDELRQNLETRLKEIEDLNWLKRKNESNFSLLSKTLDMRREGLELLRANTINSTSTTFSIVMRSMKMNGKLGIFLQDQIHQGQVVKKARTLEMSIDAHHTPSQNLSGTMIEDGMDHLDAAETRRTSSSQPGPSRKRARLSSRLNSAASEKENEMKLTDSRSLSGGERSFSTVAFVLSLWHHCSSPFKLMDEIDVFMDMVTRRVSYNALIRFAQVVSDNPGQFIFFSPLELPQINNSGSFVRVFEMPRIDRG